MLWLMLLNRGILSLWSYSATSFFSKTYSMKQYFYNMITAIKKERHLRNTVVVKIYQMYTI